LGSKEASGFTDKGVGVKGELSEQIHEICGVRCREGSGASRERILNGWEG
jgi:hypothetical protein